MTDESLLEAYVGWLEPQVGVYQQSRSYSDLIMLLARKEFVWIVPHDDNRIMDGLDIRREFYDQIGIDYGLTIPCSVLEVLVGLSRRLSFIADGDPAGWAWQLICNLELHKLSDPIGRQKAIRAEEILETVIWRTYQPDGLGGFFPLAWPEQDQRKVELWYQMECYADEIHPEH